MVCSMESGSRMNDFELIRDVLASTRSIAIVGASDKPQRDSHHVMAYLIEAGFTVYPVNPNASRIHGRPCHPSLAEAASAAPTGIDTVVCFRRSEEILPIAADAIAIGARHLWMQLGVVNEAAKNLAEPAGLKVVMNRCIMVEHQRIVRATSP